MTLPVAGGIHRYFFLSNPIAASILVVMIGGLATLPVLASADLIWLAAMLLLPLQPETILAFVYAAIPEEISKTLALLWILKWLGYHASSAEPHSLMPSLPSSAGENAHVLSPLLIGFLLGLGFALVELAVYLIVRLPDDVALIPLSAGAEGKGSEAIAALGMMSVRVLTAVPLHAGVSALAAIYWMAAAPWRAWLIPILLHGLYDLAILQAARGGGPAPLLLAYAVLALLAAWLTALHAWLRPLSGECSATAPAEGRPSPL